MLSRRLRKSQPPRPCYRLPSTADKLKRDCSHCHMDSPARTRSHRLWRVVTRRQSTTMCCCNCCCSHFIKPCSLSLWVPPAILSTPCMLYNVAECKYTTWTQLDSFLLCICPPQAILWLPEFNTVPTRLFFGPHHFYLLLQHANTSTRCRELSKRHAALWKEQLKTFMYRMDSLRVAIMYYEHEMGGREIYSKI